MIENIFKKQEKIQEKIQKQQDLNDDKNRELTDEELDQIVGGAPGAAEVSPVQLATLDAMDAQVTLTVPEVKVTLVTTPRRLG